MRRIATPPSSQGPASQSGGSFQRKASLWFLLGIVPFLIGFLWLAIVFRTTGLWLNRQHYLPAEFEVQAVSYHAGRGSGSSDQMEGVITPGGELLRVQLSRFNVMIFDSQHDASGRLPMLEEIRGKRLPVWYRRPPEGGDTFWRPAHTRVFSMTEFAVLPGIGTVLGHAGFCAAMFALAWLCVRRCLRIMRGEVKPRPSAWPWYLWPAVAALLMTSFLSWVLAVAMLTPRLSSDGTRRIDRTPHERFIAGTALVAFSALPLGSLWVAMLAVRARFSTRSRLATPQAAENEE